MGDKKQVGALDHLETARVGQRFGETFLDWVWRRLEYRENWEPEIERDRR